MCAKLLCAVECGLWIMDCILGRAFTPDGLYRRNSRVEVNFIVFDTYPIGPLMQSHHLLSHAIA